MSNEDVVRAWKDPQYRTSLSEQHRAVMPVHPSGLVELTLPELTGIFGGRATDFGEELFQSLTRAAQTCYTEPGDGCTLDCDCGQDTNDTWCGTICCTVWC